MRALGFQVQKQEVVRIMKEYDANSTGKIAFADFAEIMGEKVLARDPEEEMKKAFALFDGDDTGFISVKNLRRVSRELGEVLSEEELQAMIDEFDKDQDGKISLDEFMAIMKQTSLY